MDAGRRESGGVRQILFANDARTPLWRRAVGARRPGCSDAVRQIRESGRQRRRPRRSHSTAGATKYYQKIAFPVRSVPLIFRIFGKNQLLRVIDDAITLLLSIVLHQSLNNNNASSFYTRISNLVTMLLVLFFCSCCSIS